MSNNELFKTIEAQGRLITELRAQLEDIAKVSEKLIEHHYGEEIRHFEESIDGESCSDGWDKYLLFQNHIVSKWDELKTLINK